MMVDNFILANKQNRFNKHKMNEKWFIFFSLCLKKLYEVSNTFFLLKINVKFCMAHELVLDLIGAKTRH